MSDIVERLRGPAPRMIGPLMDEAADEIERLEADNERLRAQVRNLHGMLDREAGWPGKET